MTQLVLGTAQFGDGYGVMNTAGALTDAAVADICNTALQSGVELFDSSRYYGDAQRRLGALIDPSRRPRYISKFGLDGDGTPDIGQLLSQILNDLRVESLAGLLFHRVQDLRDARTPGVCEALREARARGIVERIGASVYDLADFETALEAIPDFDLVQLPGNVLDRRLLDHPLLTEFHQRGGVVHVRSAYLQGVLLTPPGNVPENLAGLRPVVTRIRTFAEQRGLPLIELLLGFLKHHPVVDAVVVGAATAREMRETVAAWAQAAALDFDVPMVDHALLDPRRWNEAVRP